MKQIKAVHLLNDYSGSPLVFSEALKALVADGYEISLYTATPSGEGFLSGLENVKYESIAYAWKKNKWLRLWLFLWCQWLLFVNLYRTLNRKEIVYINTLLPFGAALAGYFRGCKVVYHVHEVSISPRLLHHFLVRIASACGSQFIFVSHYVASQFSFAGSKTEVIHNSLPEAFRQQSERLQTPNLKPEFTVLMLCSLKAYKGVFEMVELAKQMPSVRFVMVLNANLEAIDAFFKGTSLPANLHLHPATSHTIPFFDQAHVVVNLSQPEGWIETFGMTLLEAMQCGRPVIAPPVGGPIELVTHGQEGYLIHSRQTSQLVAAINDMRSNITSYRKLSFNCLKKAAEFSPEVFCYRIQGAFSDKNQLNPPAINRKNLPVFGKAI